MKIDLKLVEEAAKELYIRALKRLPPDVKQGFDALAARESDAGAQRMLGTMVRNIRVAEDTDNLLCQDTGIPIYNVWIGRNVEVDGVALKEAIRTGCARSTREHPFRSSVVHPTTRVNAQDSTGRGIPVINVDFAEAPETLVLEMIPKGSGSENNSWLRMAIPAEGIDAIKTFVVDCVLEAGGMEYWESGMDMKAGDDIYDSFRSYQRQLLKEYAAMSDEFGFRVLEGRKSVHTIQEELRRQVGEFLGVSGNVKVEG